MNSETCTRQGAARLERGKVQVNRAYTLEPHKMLQARKKRGNLASYCALAQ